MTRRVLAKTGLAAATLALAIVVLEIPAWLGWVDYAAVVGLPPALRFTHLKPWANPANVRDEELLFRHRPLFRFHGDTPGDLVDLYGIATERRYTVDVVYDENGFRNPPGTNRADLVLIGDSFLEAGLVPQDEVVSARLASLLGTSATNLGHSGYGPQQELVVLRRYALPLAPKTIVWLFFEGNDLIDVGRYEEAKAGKGDLDPTKTRFRDRSFVGNVLQRVSLALRRRRGEDGPEARARAGVLRGAAGSPRLYFAFAGEPLTEADLAHLQLAEATIRAAAEITRAAGARFLLAYVPTKFRVHAGLCDFAPESLPARWKTNDLPDRVARFAAEAAIEFLDLTGPLHAAASRGELVYFEDDGHWNARGHEVAARSLAERLSR